MSEKPTAKQLSHARRRLAFRISEVVAEELRGEIPFGGGDCSEGWNIDDGCEVIASLLPVSIVEIDMEISELIAECGNGDTPRMVKGPSVVGRLRDLLGETDSPTMGVVGRAADEIERLRDKIKEHRSKEIKWIEVENEMVILRGTIDKLKAENTELRESLVGALVAEVHWFGGHATVKGLSGWWFNRHHDKCIAAFRQLVELGEWEYHPDHDHYYAGPIAAEAAKEES